MLQIPRLSIKKKFRSIAVLTSGGDAPGMNAATRAIVRYAISNGCRVFGAIKGYSGLIEDKFIPLIESSVANIIQRGGTVLKTDRCEEFFKARYRKLAAENLRRNQIDGLVVIGGDGSFAGADKFQRETKFPTIGVPGTIDNNIYGTDDTIGFDTAVNTALEAIDRIRDTASSHDRLFLVEVMGRSTGLIATHVGIGGGAETVIIPEYKESVEDLCRYINRGLHRGKTSSIIVVAEGPKPGLSTSLAKELKNHGHSPRVCILGHTQRGGTPSAHDRFLASTLGASAVAFLLNGKSGCMVGVKHDTVITVPFHSITGKKKSMPTEPLELARILAI